MKGDKIRYEWVIEFTEETNAGTINEDTDIEDAAQYDTAREFMGQVVAALKRGEFFRCCVVRDLLDADGSVEDRQYCYMYNNDDNGWAMLDAEFSGGAKVPKRLREELHRAHAQRDWPSVTA